MKWNQWNIRRMRKKQGLTQRQFAEALGTTQQMVSEWETGIHSVKNAYSKLLTLKFGELDEKEDEKSSEEAGSKSTESTDEKEVLA